MENSTITEPVNANNVQEQSSDTNFKRILGAPRLEEDLLKEIEASPELKISFLALKGPFREKFISYCTGSKGLPLTYDPVFKFIFNPEIHPGRLSNFLSLIIGKEVTVKRALPNEGGKIIEEGSLLVMDLVVEFEDGALGNVEIQKIPYTFPGERSTCYSSDLVLRQYTRVKKEKSLKFSYKDMKPIYTIIILEKSDKTFHSLPTSFLHRGKQIFDTGLNLELLQEYFFIPLDIFKDITQTISTELEAWLYCLCSEEPTIIYQIIQKFPDFREIYDDMTAYRGRIGEVLSMFSEALRLMDQNTVQLMIDEQIEQLADLNEQLTKTNEQLTEKEEQLTEKEEQLTEKDEQLTEKDEKIAQDTEQMLIQKVTIDEKDHEIKEKENRIRELEEQLKNLKY